MTADFSYDPVTAIDEASATGETAAIFADIRVTMGIPLITSIWRGLAGMDDSLGRVWALTKPIYASGLPEQALAQVIARAGLPRPEPLTPPQFASAGVSERDLRDIRAIVAAYNRSNGMNLVALAALVAPPAAESVAPAPAAPAPEWPSLRPLQARASIDDKTWTMICQVNAFGAPGPDAHVATLWRHLAHWPGLLALVHSAFAPLQARGEIAAASATVAALAREEGARMAHLCPARFDISGVALATITDYVNNPALVARMVTLGHMLADWLAARDATQRS